MNDTVKAAIKLAIAAMFGLLLGLRIGDDNGASREQEKIPALLEDSFLSGYYTAVGVNKPTKDACLTGVTDEILVSALRAGQPVGSFCTFEAADGRGELPPLFRKLPVLPR